MQLPLTAVARILFSKPFMSLLKVTNGEQFSPSSEAQEECVISTSSTRVVGTPNLHVKASLVNTTSIDLIKAIPVNTISRNLIKPNPLGLGFRV